MTLIKRKIIVVGGSAAGPAAAAKAKRVNPNNEVILYEAGGNISIGTCEIPYVLSGEISNVEKLIFYNPESFEKEKGVKVKINHRVEFIDKNKKKIFVRDLHSQKVFEDNYDKLILCTGSVKKIHPSFRSGLENVFYLKTIEDVKAIQNYINKNKINSSLVVGASYTGLEALEFVKQISNEIYLADISDLPLPGHEFEVRKILLEKIGEKKINFIGNVNDIIPYEKDGRVIRVKLNQEQIEVDFVLITIGFEPNNSLAKAANLSLNSPCGSIKVDEKQKTSDDNIYAAGDCCGVKEFITKKTRWIPLASYAHNQGHVAGSNAAGEPAVFGQIVRNIGFRFFDLNIALVGLNNEEIQLNQIKCKEVSSIGNSRVKIMPGGVKHFVKIKYRPDDKKIISANLVGGEDIIGKANLISFAIKNNIPLTKFYETDFLYTPTLSPLIETLSILGKQAGD
ncbi:MAG: FAD-dependent oxidoreductase [Ignavibacteria bacterium]|nr:FAD-dependent oxidoreductase [Ignavibacteria bacterium]